MLLESIMQSEVSDRPVIGITMGDAAGIGPEIVIKALADNEMQKSCRCVVIGDGAQLIKTITTLGSTITLASDQIVDLNNLPPMISIGTDNAVTGKASAQYIEAAVGLWRDKKIDAICTAPISKKAISLGGYDFPGHTEFLASLSGTTEFAMSFFGGNLRVVLLSTHVSLRGALELVKKDRLIELIKLSNREFERLLGRRIKLAVAGLNPHASEGGMFGFEEQNEIIPAIEHCQNDLNIDVSGPYSADTLFLRAFNGEFDAVIALYHDQATIPVKSLCFGSGVNVTLGLPFIRTSVDHGTAYDITGKGVAEASSMIAAIKLAAELVIHSRKISRI